MKDYGAGVLLVAKRDRLSRDVFVTLSVERVLSQGGAVLLSASGEGNGDTSSDHSARRARPLRAA
jgi:DNA invertase Pin-like site-specific DNA recombinase